MTIQWTLIILTSYFIGAIPTAFIYCKLKGKDIRKEGSGNVGATNAGRIFGKKAFITVFALDFLKGFLPIMATSFMFPNHSSYIFSAFVFLILGHVWPIYLKFKGGKGVATSVGGVFAVMPGASLLCAGVFLVVFLVTRTVSLGSMIAAISLPLWVKLLGQPQSYLIFSSCLAFLIVFTHRSNLKRLVKGEEHSFKKPKKDGEAK